MMDKPDDRPDPELAQSAQSLLGPSPVDFPRRHALPQNRITQRANSERREALEVVGPVVVARERELVDEGVAHAHAGAFGPGPHFQSRTGNLSTHRGTAVCAHSRT